MAAPGDMVAVTIGQAYLVGSEEAAPLVAASLLLPDQAMSDFLTIGVLSGGEVATIDLAGINPADDANPSSIMSLIDNASGGLINETIGDPGDAFGTVAGALDGIDNAVGGGLGAIDGAEETLGPIGDLAGDLGGGDATGLAGDALSSTFGEDPLGGVTEPSAASLLGPIEDALNTLLEDAPDDSLLDDADNPVIDALSGATGAFGK